MSHIGYLGSEKREPLKREGEGGTPLQSPTHAQTQGSFGVTGPDPRHKSI